MATVYAIHAAEEEKLEQVKKEMLTMGRPTIRVVDCGDFLMALEGSHRLAAAAQLGIEPDFIVSEQDDEIDYNQFDWSDDYWFESEMVPAGVLAGELWSSQAQSYNF